MSLVYLLQTRHCSYSDSNLCTFDHSLATKKDAGAVEISKVNFHITDSSKLGCNVLNLLKFASACNLLCHSIS